VRGRISVPENYNEIKITPKPEKGQIINTENSLTLFSDVLKIVNEIKNQ